MVDEALKRRQVAAYNKLFRLFAVDIQYAVYHESDNKQSDDSGFGDIGDAGSNDNYNDWQSTKDLLTPTGSSASSSLGNQLQVLSGATAESFDYEWISKKDVPLKTKVKYKNKTLKVKKKSDYDDIVGLFLYQLSDRSDDNVQVQR